MCVMELGHKSLKIPHCPNAIGRNSQMLSKINAAIDSATTKTLSVAETLDSLQEQRAEAFKSDIKLTIRAHLGKGKALREELLQARVC